MWNYSEKVKDHFFNPRNARILEDANAVGDVGSISCGDALRLMLKVDPDNEVILDAGFQTFGCGSAIASSSALTEMIIGKTLADAEGISNQDIADYLDGLPPEKMHCSVMGKEALEAAIAQYRGVEWCDDHEEGALICKCFAVDEAKIVKAVRENGLTTLTEVIHYTKAGGGCSTCHEKIEQVLDKVLASGSCNEALQKAYAKSGSVAMPAASVTAAAKPVAEQGGPLWQQVSAVLAEMRPHLQADGGDVTLIGVSDDKVEVALSGNCMGCMMTDMTLAWIQQKLMEALGRYIRVVSVTEALV
ncbi:MAG: Fe-S cluster assembly protein NifU [Aeromonadaceae bacterium]